MDAMINFGMFRIISGSSQARSWEYIRILYTHAAETSPQQYQKVAPALPETAVPQNSQ